MMVEIVFDAFDEDKNGFLDYRELTAILAMDTEEDNTHLMNFLFAIFDTNKNGKVEAKDLVKILRVIC